MMTVCKVQLRVHVLEPAIGLSLEYLLENEVWNIYVSLVIMTICVAKQGVILGMTPYIYGVITPNQIPLTTIVTYLQKSYRSRISNHWATIPACSVVPPIYKKSKKSYCHISF